jgi:hypothetical protein
MMFSPLLLSAFTRDCVELGQKTTRNFQAFNPCTIAAIGVGETKACLSGEEKIMTRRQWLHAGLGTMAGAMAGAIQQWRKG